MIPLRRCFVSVVLACACGLGRAGGATTVGLDLSVDGTIGLAGAAAGGESLQALALAHAEWLRDGRGGTLAAHLSALALSGRGPTGRYVGDFLGASNQEGHESVRLYEWWLEHNAGYWSMRAGAQLGDAEFATTEGGGEFLNSAFGWPAFISANTVNTGPAFFVPALGVRVKHRFAERGTWQLGVFDGDTFDSAEGDPGVNRHGTHLRLGGGQGAFVIGELAWITSAGRTLKLGAWWHTTDFADLRDDAGGQPHAISGAPARMHGGNGGAYAALEFPLGAPVDGGEAATTAFVRVGGAPSDRNAVAWAVDLGVSRRGLIPGRPDDVAFLGVVRAIFSERLAEHERLSAPGAPVSDHEQVIELGYAIALSERWTVKPDVQHIRFAGGRARREDALVFLLRSQLCF